ncbi:hypothetical protein ACFSL6_23995 [Paenibacillus thailandensis]|uniref:Uncharacterized protein n=1 Tax=Paenibacillus thailandensis TaxID=393250 RepID=A0ABW5R3J9_9BACL
MHRLRYVLRPDGLFFVSILDRPTPVSFVSQQRFFIRTTGIAPNKTLGTVRVNDVQLRALGVLPAKEVTFDACTPIAADAI